MASTSKSSQMSCLFIWHVLFPQLLRVTCQTNLLTSDQHRTLNACCQTCLVSQDISLTRIFSVEFDSSIHISTLTSIPYTSPLSSNASWKFSLGYSSLTFSYDWKLTHTFQCWVEAQWKWAEFWILRVESMPTLNLSDSSQTSWKPRKPTQENKKARIQGVGS